MDLPGTLACASAFERLCLEQAAAAGFSEKTAFHIGLAAREAVLNALLHGSSSEPVSTSCTVDERGLTFCVRDRGCGFDPAAVADPCGPANLLRPSGRGIALIRAAMDEVNFRQLHPGTELSALKRRVQPQRGEAEKGTSVSLKFKTRQVEGVTILDLNGNITLGEGSTTLRDAMREALALGSNRVLLNMKDVEYVDSSGIGELVSAYTTVKNRGGELKLLDPGKKVHDVLNTTKLTTIFEVAGDERQGITSFGT